MTYPWDSAHMERRIQSDAQQHGFTGRASETDSPEWWLWAVLDGRWASIMHIAYPWPPDHWMVQAGFCVDGVVHVAHHSVETDSHDAHFHWLTSILGRCEIRHEPQPHVITPVSAGHK